MISFPNCKINLGLNILRKRSDGFHDVSTLMLPIPFHDVLEIIKSNEPDKCQFSSSGLPIPGKIEQNLCVKAYNLLDAEFSLPSVKIHLHKVIPMGGGLGGGSSNGAETLKILNNLFELDLSVQELKNFAAQLGSDCPFFIENKPQIATGRGEVLSPIDINLENKFIVLLFPDIHVSTKEAYSEVVPNEEHFILQKIQSLQIEDWKNHITNDFEKPVFEKHFYLKELKKKLYHFGAEFSLMSGSGSTIYGVFDIQPKSEWFDEVNCDYKILGIEGV